jgi:hypothetical protein
MAVSPDYPVSIVLRTVDREKSTSADHGENAVCLCLILSLKTMKNPWIIASSLRIINHYPYLFDGHSGAIASFQAPPYHIKLIIYPTKFHLPSGY